MNAAKHPLALSSTALRLREHQLLDIEEMLGADVIDLVGDQVTFTRRARPGEPQRQWRGLLGDWLVHEHEDQWRIVPDPPCVATDVTPGPALRPDETARDLS